MLIRKLFKFENAHIVRNCSSDRCRFSIHGHSYKIEVLLEANALDNGQMVYDFGLMKGTIRDVIDAFDHAICFWDRDEVDYINWAKQYSQRWIAMPVSPSAEQFSRLFFVLIDAILSNTVMANGEQDVTLHSIIAHETETGYAQCFRADAYNPKMGLIDWADIVFSDQCKAEWRDPTMLDKVARKEPFRNPTIPLQVR